MVLSLFESPRIYAAARCEYSNDTMDVPLFVPYYLRTGKRSPLVINDDFDTLTEDEDSQTETRVPCPGPTPTDVSSPPSPTTHHVAATSKAPSLFSTRSQSKSDSPSAYDHPALPRNVDEGKRPMSHEADEPERSVFGAIFFIALASMMVIALFVSPKVGSSSDEESQNTSPTAAMDTGVPRE
ncbi:hypothetical protein THAOC_16140 [Thalassiosira oceanica]|uniref:Transmembrane protein n=1 Tax=Thalassiosira oceanica TaxID=159749 RepID=K0SE50_THAOC|nr:hypothetical protein THAOC_16140 [Thalassiosira oceanica]|eukprot:EJK63219.1 hypothetical protein THAOC_16140 [Thalassiosira oceanica]